MKHGMVQNGKTTTLYGATATNWLAQRTVENCETIKDAQGVLRAARSPGFRAQLLAAFGDRFAFPKKFLAELAALDKKYRTEEEARKKRSYAERAATYKVRKSNGASASRCCLCRKPIVKGEAYHAGTWQYRAHEACVKTELGTKKAKEARV